MQLRRWDTNNEQPKKPDLCYVAWMLNQSKVFITNTLSTFETAHKNIPQENGDEIIKLLGELEDRISDLHLDSEINANQEQEDEESEGPSP